MASASASSAEIVHPKLVTELRPVEELMAVRDFVESLYFGSRPSDEIMCTAWVESHGTSRFVETNHPYRAGEVLSGSVEFPGAKNLRVVLHPMCSTPEGVKLSLEGGGKSLGQFGGVVDTTKDSTPWRNGAIDVQGTAACSRSTVPSELLLVRFRRPRLELRRLLSVSVDRALLRTARCCAVVQCAVSCIFLWCVLPPV